MQSTYIGCALKRTFEMPSRVHRILQITGEQQLKAIFINLYERAILETHSIPRLLVASGAVAAVYGERPISLHDD
jgi:hypothetical protein